MTARDKLPALVVGALVLSGCAGQSAATEVAPHPAVTVYRPSPACLSYVRLLRRDFRWQRIQSGFVPGSAVWQRIGAGHVPVAGKDKC